MSVVLSEYLPLLATAPNGIQKLRGLILELAVRGRLVPQDPNDEPASLLLKRIAKERARLEAEGACKKSKATPLDAKDVPPFPLPAGWVLSQLSDLTLVLNGRAYAKDELLSEGTPVLRVGNLFTSNHWYYSNLQLEDDKYCDQGDLLYSWSASFGPFIWAGPKVIYHYHIWKLRLFDESSLSKEFFYRFLLEKTAEIKAAGHGVSMIHMTKEKMEKILVPVPPLAEQHRIVAKVDELMALCDRLEEEQTDADSAHATLVETLLGTLIQSTDAADRAANWQRLSEHFDALFSTEASLDALKQTILQLAVMGKLVPQDPNDEPASSLLQKLPKPKKALPPIEDSELLFDIPTNWQWTRLGEIFIAGSGTTPARARPEYFQAGTEHWVKTTDLNNAIVTSCEELITPEAVSDCNLTCYPTGTVCIAMYGGAGTIGKTGMLGINSTINQSVFALPPTNHISPTFTHCYLKSIRRVWMRFAAGLRIAANINGQIIKNMVFPVPPLDEQLRIVAKVDELMAVCDRLKADLAESRKQQDRLATILIETALKAA